MTLSLVILAAGKGSRFGGDKPFAQVGPNGQSLFEYSVHYALNAGFEHVLFVINETQNADQFSNPLKHYGKRLRVEFVVQPSSGTGLETADQDSAPQRSKPWGTGHAVLVCKERIDNPFVVINADDYHGRDGFIKIGRYLSEHSSNSKSSALVGYTLGNTLSRSGGVNRGVCTVGDDNYLESVYEVMNIKQDRHSSITADATEHPIALTPCSIVSMTFWGFQPELFSIFESAFQKFIKSSIDLVNDEFTIPEVVDMAIRTGTAQTKVLQTSAKWMGITYSQDLAEARDFFLQPNNDSLHF